MVYIYFRFPPGPITRNLLTHWVHWGQNCIAGEHQNLLKEVWTQLIVPSEILIWLVVEPTPLKNMKVNWDDYSKYMEK